MKLNSWIKTQEYNYLLSLIAILKNPTLHLLKKLMEIYFKKAIYSIVKIMLLMKVMDLETEIHFLKSNLSEHLENGLFIGNIIMIIMPVDYNYLKNFFQLKHLDKNSLKQVILKLELSLTHSKAIMKICKKPPHTLWLNYLIYTALMNLNSNPSTPLSLLSKILDLPNKMKLNRIILISMSPP
jgi:hypothetical protein